MIKFTRATCATILFITNTLICTILLYPIGIIKVLVPIKSFKVLCLNKMIRVAELWIEFNNLNIELTQKIRWDIRGIDKLEKDRSYFIVANHQSWLDIPVLQKALNRKIPFLRFFLKSELIYLPIFGLAWWAMDLPFMKRHSHEYLKRHPEKRFEDYERIVKSCAVFKGQNTSILNFLEGTRFNFDKKASQSSPYRNLLVPKTGGFTFVLNAMGDQFDSVLDVTIFYPNGPTTIWEFITGRVQQIVVHVDKVEIPNDFKNGDYINDVNYRNKIQTWIRDIWNQKDFKIETLRKSTLLQSFE